MATTYPILLNIVNLRVVIIGGGSVGLRKAISVLECGATDVRGVSPVFTGQWPQTVQRTERDYAPDCLDAARLVFACTDSADVNRRIVADCRSRRIWVNRADRDEADDAQSDFASPAVFRQGQITLAVSAGGSPAIARAVRDDLAMRLDPEWAALAEVAAGLRAQIRQNVTDDSDRRRILRDLSSRQAAIVLSTDGIEGLQRWLAGRNPSMPQRMS